MVDKQTTELTLVIEALTSLASAITWTIPNDSSSVRYYVTEAFEAIDKLKELSVDLDNHNQNVQLFESIENGKD